MTHSFGQTPENARLSGSAPLLFRHLGLRRWNGDFFPVHFVQACLRGALDSEAIFVGNNDRMLGRVENSWQSTMSGDPFVGVFLIGVGDVQKAAVDHRADLARSLGQAEQDLVASDIDLEAVFGRQAFQGV